MVLMNSENSKTCKSLVLILKLTDSLLNLSIKPYKNIKSFNME